MNKLPKDSDSNSYALLALVCPHLVHKVVFRMKYKQEAAIGRTMVSNSNSHKQAILTSQLQILGFSIPPYQQQADQSKMLMTSPWNLGQQCVLRRVMLQFVL